MQTCTGVEIVVGTPGRVKDFIETCKLDVKRVNFFILDEVDGLLSQGHKDMIHTLYRGLPKEASDGRRLQVIALCFIFVFTRTDVLQMIVCSATLHSPDVKKLAKDLMFHPAWVDLKVCKVFRPLDILMSSRDKTVSLRQSTTSSAASTRRRTSKGLMLTCWLFG